MNDSTQQNTSRGAGVADGPRGVHERPTLLDLSLLGESTRENAARSEGAATGEAGRLGGSAGFNDACVAASSDHRVPACSPSDVQLAFMAAHRAWAKRYAPHLLEEWND